MGPSLLLADPDLIGRRLTVEVPMSDDIDQLRKGHIDRGLPESERRVKDKQIEWYDRLVDRNLIVTRFNTTLFKQIKLPIQVAHISVTFGSMLKNAVIISAL